MGVTAIITVSPSSYEATMSNSRFDNGMLGTSPSFTGRFMSKIQEDADPTDALQQLSQSGRSSLGRNFSFHFPFNLLTKDYLQFFKTTKKLNDYTL